MIRREVDGGVAAAYSATGAAWQRGPGRVYDVLADHLLAVAADLLGGAGGDRLGWSGQLVLDAGAGTGAATRAIARTGGRPVAADAAHGMLVAARPRPPSVLADVRSLPLVGGALAGYVAAFCLNHVPDPAAGLAEAARVVRREAPIIASAHAADDGHPVKQAAERAAGEAGWTPPPWYGSVRTDAIPALATVEGAFRAAEAAGLHRIGARHVSVPIPGLTGEDLVAWRLGMAQIAPFVAGLPPHERRRLAARARELLGEHPPLVRRIVVLAAVP